MSSLDGPTIDREYFGQDIPPDESRTICALGLDPSLRLVAKVDGCRRTRARDTGSGWLHRMPF